MTSENENDCFILPAESDIYNGMTVDTTDLTLTEEEFENVLTASLDNWKTNGIRGVWFKVNLGNSSYIPVLVKHGFTFHHAQSLYAMLTRWLTIDQPNLIPVYPYTRIAVGGIVINDNKHQVLVIQENYCRIPEWKLPGGTSESGEDFVDTAVREILEETGIETEFVSVIAVCHRHKLFFACSEIHIFCHLRPITEKIQVEDEDEVAKCEWMNIDIFRNHTNVSDFDKYIMTVFLENKQLQYAIKATSVFPSHDDHHKVYNVQSLEEHDEND